MKTFLISLTCLMALFCVSCETDDPKSQVPTFSNYSLNVNRNYLISGEKITVTAVQASKGSYLSRADYAWTLSADTTVCDSSATVVYDKQNSNPQFTFIVPQVTGDTYCTVSLTATYINSCAQFTTPAKPATEAPFTCSYTLSTWQNTVSMSKTYLIKPEN